jgi:hypothetical protein
LAVNIELFPVASAAMLMLMLIHCDWLEYTCNRAELIVAPGGTFTPVKRNPA